MPRTATFAYWLDYWLFPLAIVTVIALDWNICAGVCHTCAGVCNIWAWLALFAAGVVAFTYVEYWTHRVILHRRFYHATHERHHKHPEEYVVFPWCLVPIGFGAAYAVARYSGLDALWIGFATGYVWFIYWHHVLHHLDLRSWPIWVRRYAEWHERHHERPGCNFGITHPGFDWLHGTYR